LTLAVLAISATAHAIDQLGRTVGELFRQIDTYAIRLPQALDFGDSYADVALRVARPLGWV
jgi:hypothetical protein